MCLLKRDNKDTNCGHEECRNYYLMNKQLCVRDAGQPQLQANLLNNQALLLQNQGQQRSFVPTTMPFNMNIQQILNNKPAAKPADNSNSDDTGAVLLNKKKFKTNDENISTEYQQSQKPVNDMPLNLADLGVSSHQLGGVFDKRVLLNNQLLNSLLIANNQPGIIKPETQFSQLNDMMGSVFQAPQMVNPFENANNQGGITMNQLLMRKPSQISTAQENTPIESRVKTEQDADYEGILKDFQTRTLGLLFNQNKMLLDLKEKNDIVQDTLACLIGEVNTLKKLIDQPTAETSSGSGNPMLIHQIIGNSSETGSMESLMTYLYGPRPEFNYFLVLKNEFPLPLYRERNFKFTVMLVDQNGNTIENSNRIPLSISIYSSENPPKYIDVNTAGNKILKGFTEKDLVNGCVTFEKIQIKEVTSHFRNGWVFFVVHPKLQKTSNNNVLLNNNGVVIDSQKIKPLVLEKVIVKAKKTKEKADGSQGSQQGDSPKENVYD